MTTTVHDAVSPEPSATTITPVPRTSGDQMQLNIWCSTGTVGSYLNHPRRGKTQLFRRAICDHRDLRELFENPRAHGHGGYYERQQQQQSPRTTVKNMPCPGCGKMYGKMSAAAQHFESGSCCMCPGVERAGRAAYAYTRQMELQAGTRFTNAQQLLTFNGDGEVDWGHGYEAGGQNYSCQMCFKTFAQLHSLISHCESRPQCRGGNNAGLLTHRR